MKLSASFARTWMTVAPLGLLWAASPAGAQEVRFPEASVAPRVQMTGGLTHTDNVFRTLDEQGDDIATIGIDIDAARSGSRLDYSIFGNVFYEEYLDDSYDGNVRGRLNATGSFEIVPEVFEWLAQESFSQVDTDPLRAKTPSNLDNFNYFTTGPRVRMQLGSTTRLLASGDYSRTNSSAGSDVPGIADLSGDQFGGTLALERELSAASLVALTARSYDINFDEAAADSDYTQQDAFASYQMRGSRTLMEIDAGYTQVRLRGTTSGGPLARFNLSRQVSSSSTLTFMASRRFASAGEAMRSGVSSTLLELPSMPTSTPDPFVETTAAGGWGHERSRTAFGLQLLHTRERYETNTQFDRTRRRASAYASRRVTPRLTLAIDGSRTKETFDTQSFENTQTNLGLVGDWAFGRRTALSLRYEYDRRSSPQPGSDYTENRVGLFVTYHAVGTR